MFRLEAVLGLAILILTGCADRLHNKEQVQAAVVERLQSHSGLDLKQLDITTTGVSFEKNKAYATVAFHPKGDPSINSGMTMKYTLQEQAGKWVVVNVGDTDGHGSAGISSPEDGRGETGGALPPGHPPLNSTASPSGVPQAR